MEHPSIIFKIVCPDRPGLVSKLTSWISDYGGNIKHSDHHTDQDAGLFLSRIEWNSIHTTINRKDIYDKFQTIAVDINGKFNINYSDEIPNVAIFVSKQNHCLIDLLWRVRNGELKMNVPLIISNHPDLESIANDFNSQFVYFDTVNSSKSDVEDQILKLIDQFDIDFVVLAKYMQILSDSFVQKFSSIINIHHSFLPAFKGAQPYHRAWKRGVKLIGATAHYVTKDLDEGPIIEQCTVNVSHRDEVDDLIRKGRDIERVALARAVRLHLNHQVFVYKSKTAVFD
ncbi:formyltetrahydrofolate deformylase [Prochlorococcus marinus subsp. pastoris str. CCMP1986]|uniref:Formyltetrahydrofolate deformylase n=1 Tax=Prochlorococcus marinus subsp. pastoris (strain CCMP1986 / NIES-2087 / MED4) TaxID=59919 RepID=Q7UZG5_PROMP|nr:formyltetrahydrofolate deformylase [Prochlorococcus marinus]KGF86949.1 Formyltetrahydrofolate deformylase [Prochlorococcus marinus str. EQPAC1]CAE20161.1 formyltetrahydrofolate deformylase [Prochlorococcus marinus subsp. pastoris str. CCMP1986]